MVCMIGFFNEMEILEVEINVKTKVNMMLETLLDSFKQFKLDYSMNKLVNLLKLIRELHRVEGILKDQKSVHMVVNSLNSSTKKKKNKNGNIKKKKKSSRARKIRAKGRTSVYFVERKVGLSFSNEDFILENLYSSFINSFI